jgi:predicted metalloprotease with PDZ domain
VHAGDELLAIDERRVPVEGLDAPLSRHRPGERVTLLVSRWNLLRRLPVVLGSAPADRFDLELARGASAAQRARTDAWLGAR